MGRSLPLLLLSGATAALCGDVSARVLPNHGGVNDARNRIRIHGVGYYAEGVGFYVDGVGLIADPVATTIEDSAPQWKKLQDAMETPTSNEADGAAARHSRGAREEAARKLIGNRKAVLRDVTNPMPLTQPGLERAGIFDAPYVDQALRETARRLLGRGLDNVAEEQLDGPTEQAFAWARAMAYLDQRLQATPAERPGRAPDMSEEAAAAFRAVLREVGGQANN